MGPSGKSPARTGRAFLLRGILLRHGPVLLHREPSDRGAMARITVEDCIRKLPNRFHWVQIAAIRTKQLRGSAKPLVNSEENRTAVVPPLREIAAGYVKPD